MKSARPWLILFVAVAIAGYGCSSGSTTATTTPSSTATTTSAGTTTTTVGSTPASATIGTAAAGLTSSLSGLGLTGDQAGGAVGSVLSLAQGKLSPSDYTKVAAAVPGAAGYVQQAQNLGAVSSSEPLTSMDGLSAAYSKLGISPEIASQVTPLITNYIGKAGGPTVAGLMSSVVK